MLLSAQKFLFTSSLINELPFVIEKRLLPSCLKSRAAQEHEGRLKNSHLIEMGCRTTLSTQNSRGMHALHSFSHTYWQPAFAVIAAFYESMVESLASTLLPYSIRTDHFQRLIYSSFGHLQMGKRGSFGAFAAVEWGSMPTTGCFFIRVAALKL